MEAIVKLKMRGEGTAEQKWMWRKKTKSMGCLA